ncbi:MAG: glycosyltransferase [Caulobacteraceae bacterium]|nr:glycosyltransferase [Caulobacteraceae bacterium]
MSASDADLPVVGVFRLQLFKRSETFIPAQVARYSRYRPLYIGRTRFGDIPAGAEAAIPKGGALTALRVLALGDPGPFVEALAGRRIDVLHAHFAIDAVHALPLARRLGVPLVTTLHGFDVTTRDAVFLRSGRPALIAAVLRRRALRRQGALFLSVSQFIRRAALKKGFPEDRTIVHPIGIDLQRFSPGAEFQPGLVVHVARLVEKKGTAYLLQAMAQVVERQPRARLVIIGDGPLRGQLEAQAARLNLAGAVTFLGGQPHEATVGWMARAAVIAVPSVTAASGDSEGLPTVIFEAGGMGVPVVASDTSGIPEAVIDGQTGFLAPERDTGALAERIGRILTDPILRGELGRGARNLMETRFDLARQTATLEECYDRVRCAGRFVSQ